MAISVLGVVSMATQKAAAARPITWTGLYISEEAYGKPHSGNVLQPGQEYWLWGGPVKCKETGALLNGMKVRIVSQLDWDGTGTPHPQHVRDVSTGEDGKFSYKIQLTERECGHKVTYGIEIPDQKGYEHAGMFGLSSICQWQSNTKFWPDPGRAINAAGLKWTVPEGSYKIVGKLTRGDGQPLENFAIRLEVGSPAPTGVHSPLRPWTTVRTDHDGNFYSPSVVGSKTQPMRYAAFFDDYNAGTNPLPNIQHSSWLIDIEFE